MPKNEESLPIVLLLQPREEAMQKDKIRLLQDIEEHIAMEIKGKVHCFFEQSGTFKNEFIKLGIPAEDYDIQNNFGQTDHQIDLFQEIETAYGGGQSVFDSITCDDLIMAFFPCIYFTGSSNPCYFRLDNNNYKSLTMKEKFDAIIERADLRNTFYKLLYKMVGVALMKGIRIVIENPFSSLHYLHNNFLQEPSIIDNDRTRRGDYFTKPTGYWFFHCNPSYGLFTEQRPKKHLSVWKCKSASKAGLCSEERSMISPDYARNFICDFIIGKEQNGTQLNLFE